MIKLHVVDKLVENIIAAYDYDAYKSIMPELTIDDPDDAEDLKRELIEAAVLTLSSNGIGVDYG